MSQLALRSNGDKSHQAFNQREALLLMVQNKALLTHRDLIQVGRVCRLLLCSEVRSGVGKEGRTDWHPRVFPNAHLDGVTSLGELAAVTVELRTHLVQDSQAEGGDRGRKAAGQGLPLPRVGHRAAVRAHPTGLQTVLVMPSCCPPRRPPHPAG